ncbi:MAG TPA: response regulator [Gemmatimonadaceae bacterium]|nr:response regulator [Gemmatimonadaceae bacterium]
MLIVEDNALASGALRVLFEQTGHRVGVAATAAEAVGMVARDTPDLMLLDLTLPDGDGFGVLQRLRAGGCFPRVVVALTGHDEPALAERCADLGCRDMLLKPVPTRELLRRASEWLAE